MDAIISRIVDYATASRYADLPAVVVHECKRRVIDTLGCGLGAFDAEPSKIARKAALRVNVPKGACVLGTTQRTLPELAAFANGVMQRYLDGNDVFPGATGGGHPSDTISSVLAVAEATGADGKSAITGIAVAYEVFHNLLHSVSVRERGLDHVFHVAVAGAVGAAKVLDLNREKTANAIGLAVTPNIPLGATRRGNLSMWKGGAAGNAARNGVFAALLAADGMTGPEKPIDGAHGLEALVGKLDLAPFPGNSHPFRITEAYIKNFMSVGASQAGITAALQLGEPLAVEDIESVTVWTYWQAWSEIGSEPEKWHPTNRETADHSMPYIIAAILIDGGFSEEIFDSERIDDPRIHQLTDKISVKEDLTYSKQFPDIMPCRIEIVMKRGERKTLAVDYPRGHPKNAMTDEEVNTKFRGLVKHALPAARIERALKQLWKLDEIKDIGSIFEALQVQNQ